MAFNLLDYAIKVLEKAPKKELHINDIATAILEAYPNIQDTNEVFKRKLNTKLASEVKKNGSRITKPKNKNGASRKGIYRLKRQIGNQTNLQLALPPSVVSSYTGKAGEHAVLSELLFWDFNASIMAVDDGIDVVASKNNKYFHIQVKTSNGKESQKGMTYSFKVDQQIYSNKQSSQTFYIFLLRRKLRDRIVNDFLVLQNSIIDKYIEDGIVKGKGVYNFSVTIDQGKRFILNSKEDVTKLVNRFDLIN